MTEHDSPPRPNVQPPSAEARGPEYLNGLIDQLGLIRTPELDEAGVMVANALTDPGVSSELRAQAWHEYAASAEAAVEHSPIYAHAQIAVILHKAMLFAATDNPLGYIQELDSAETYTENSGLVAIAADLNAEIRLISETLQPSAELLVVKLKGSIDEQNREYLRDLLHDGASLEDLIGDAYGMILEEGSDPDEVLQSLGMTQ